MKLKFLKFTLVFIFLSQNIFSQLGKDIDDIRDFEKRELISRKSDNNITRFNFKSATKTFSGKKCDEIIIYHINNNSALCEMISYVSCSASANSYAKDLNKIAVEIEPNKWKNYKDNSIYKLEIDGNIVIVEHFKKSERNSKKIKLSEGAKLLFYDSKSEINVNKSEKISISDMNSIYLETGFYLSDNRLFFVNDYDGLDENAFNAYVKFIDLNNDIYKDVSISYGNTYTSGMTGNNIALFTKENRNDNYSKILDVATLNFKLLNKKTNGFFDLKLEGRGYEVPIWKWNGVEYNFSHHKKE
jgi:hypothetical protein